MSADPIRAALETLPGAEAASAAVIGFWAGTLRQAIIPGPLPMPLSGAATEHEMQARLVPWRRAAGELRSIACMIRHLDEALDSMSVTAAMGLDGMTAHRLTEVRRLLSQAAPGAETSADRADASAAQAGGSGTKQPDTASAALALTAARAFHSITGRKPTMVSGHRQMAHGPFIDLVAAVFHAGGIDASPEVYAKQAVRVLREEFDRRSVE